MTESLARDRHGSAATDAAADMPLGRRSGNGEGYALRFLGIGGGSSQGSPLAAVERGAQPLLMIDCGPGAVDRYRTQYGALPHSVYLTHIHMDHVGGLEELFHAVAPLATDGRRPLVRLFVPAAIVAGLQERVAGNAFVRAEGGTNFWDAFQLVPVSGGFWLDSLWFRVFEVRHMQPRFCYGVSLPGAFLFTGDTRPIPEVLREYATEGEIIFHDCAVRANPAHSGFIDLLNEYPGETLDRIVVYHYGSVENGRRLESHGFRIAKLGRCHDLPAPLQAGAAAARLAS
ncbi:MAG TPA: MBL fold metallo-hydrolase [Woeseiaceae bacterium]|nr:MBL fold metallo-hydrolase [Woeseiaceae bacterium]